MANYARDFTYQDQQNTTATGLLNFKLLIDCTDIVSHFITYLNYISVLICFDF